MGLLLDQRAQVQSVEDVGREPGPLFVRHGIADTAADHVSERGDVDQDAVGLRELLAVRSRRMMSTDGGSERHREPPLRGELVTDELVRRLRKLERLAVFVVVDLQDREVPEVVQKTCGEALVRGRMPEQLRERLARGRGGERMAKEAQSSRAAHVQGVEDGDGEHQLLDRAEAEKADGARDVGDSPGDRVVGGVDDLQHLGGERGVALHHLGGFGGRLSGRCRFSGRTGLAGGSRSRRGFFTRGGDIRNLVLDRGGVLCTLLHFTLGLF